MAFAAARLAARFAMSRGARRAAAYSARAAYRSAARAASRAGRYAKVWTRRNPMTAGFMAGGAAENLVRGARKRNLQSIRKGRIVKPRKAGPVPTNPSSRVSAKYAVAPSMQKFKKAKKLSAVKVPKTISTHYKDYGLFNANGCMYINHEHWGSNDRFWYAIGCGLAKTLLPKAKLFPGKRLDDPLIGPRTNPADTDSMIPGDNLALSDTIYLQLVFATEGDEGVVTYDTRDVLLVDVTADPDQYRTFKYVAQQIASHLQDMYFGQNKTWLFAAQFRTRGSGANNTMTESDMSGTPITILNLDDAEICVYVKSLIKFQNVTLSDSPTVDGTLNPAAYARDAIDANPLEGRVYTAKGQHPIIDTDLLASGDRTLDKFFGDTQINGLTLCGHANAHTGADVGRIAHLPTARRLYGNQTVKSGTIHISAGQMKFHKTYFTMKRTFRSLADVCSQQQTAAIDEANLMKDSFNRHTLFGFTIQHKHGENTIKLGYNRETELSCMVKHKHIHNPLKQHFAYNDGQQNITVNPSEYPL